MFTKFKKKAIIENSNKILDKLWNNNNINKDEIEIYRQIINNTIMNISIEKIYISPIIIKNDFKILDIGCGIMTWEKELINPSNQYNIFIYCVDKHNYFKNISDEDFGGVKKITHEVNIIKENYDVTIDGLKYKDNTINYIFQRDMISVYNIKQWNIIIKEMYRILEHEGYAELIEYDIKIKNIFNINTELSDIYNETLIDIFKLNRQEIYTYDLYEKKLRGLMTRNMLLAYSYFKEPLSNTLKLKGYNFNESLEILKKEWETNNSYMEIYIFSAKKQKNILI